MSKRVAVLMGGWSAEREVSLVSGAAVVKALQHAGYTVSAIDAQRDMGDLMTRLYPRPDVVFNALHGRFGEDGCVQGLLNILGVPYTHSGLLASAVAMDKPMAKRLLAAVGIAVAADRVVRRADLALGDPLPRPYVVKPVNEGSSVGVRLVREGDENAALDDGNPDDPVMVERYIPGREFTVAVMGDRPLCVTEIVTDHVFYDYEAKYVPGGSRHILPANIDQGLRDLALRTAALAHQTLGCRGVSRTDMRYDGEHLYVLELNTQPGMTPTSLVPEQAAHVGLSFAELASWMVENAACDA